MVGRNLLRLGIEPSGTCTDAEFARRAYLDIVGTLPTAAEARAFLADDRSDRRAHLVEELLTRPEFGQYWSLWLLDVLRVNGRTIGVENLAVFADWIRKGLEGDRSLGTMVREILTAVGDGTENAAANFLRRETDPKLQMELTTEALMGSRSRCAQCHNHPFDSWTQTQYHQMAAFFVRVNKTEKGIALADHGENRASQDWRDRHSGLSGWQAGGTGWRRGSPDGARQLDGIPRKRLFRPLHGQQDLGPAHGTRRCRAG